MNIPFRFKGSASEYFKIWIVNLSLTLVTLGVYSAWAKVRRKRYFYAHTLLDEAPFAYHAEPLTILKGRAIAFALFLLYLLIDNYSPRLQLVFVIVFILLLPWIVVRAQRFNAVNSSYRRIRFAFQANYGEAFWVFIGLPFLIPFSLGLIYPYFVQRRARFYIERSAYGITPLQFGAAPRAFYAVYFKVVSYFVAILIVVAAFDTVFPGSLEAIRLEAIGGHPFFLIAASAVSAIAYLLFYAYVETTVTNLIWNHVSLQAQDKLNIEEQRLQCKLEAKHIAWLYVSNAVAIIASLGLLIPWAKIRMTRYRVECLSLSSSGGLDHFVAGMSDQARATGEEIGEIFDLDIGL